MNRSRSGTGLKAKAYLLNQFEHYGIKTPVRRSLCKMYFSEHRLTDIRELTTITKACFQHAYREFTMQVLSCMLCIKNYGTNKALRPSNLVCFIKCWWDSVDTIASDWIHPYFKLYPEEMQPVHNDGIFLRTCGCKEAVSCFRSSEKKDTDTVLLSKYIKPLQRVERIFYSEGNWVGAKGVWKNKSGLG